MSWEIIVKYKEIKNSNLRFLRTEAVENERSIKKHHRMLLSSLSKRVPSPSCPAPGREELAVWYLLQP